MEKRSSDSGDIHHNEIKTFRRVMSNKTPSIVSVIVTVIALFLTGIVITFGQLIALNGASESQAFNAMSISLICQSVGLLLAVILASWLTNLLIVKISWNKALAVFVAVIVATGFGGLISFLSVIVAIPLAGIR